MSKDAGTSGHRPQGAYDLGALGWLLFEQLCAAWLQRAAGVPADRWSGSADTHRFVIIEDDLPAGPWGEPMTGPVIVLTAFERSRAPRGRLLRDLDETVSQAAQQRGRKRGLGSGIVLTNLPAGPVIPVAKLAVPGHRILGSAELGALLEADVDLRLAHPSVLGVRRDGPVVSPAALVQSSLDLDAAIALASIFVATGPYHAALDALRAHAFCVLTGPPEMGKTAAARMIALALLGAGWEAHECTRPEEMTGRLAPDRAQVFIADDAFGSTEYRPEAAERWAGALPHLLHATDQRHWLLWTSRPAPLKAALRSIHRERGGEHFPAPAQVHVDAAQLHPAEKALILLRHAQDPALNERARAIVRRHGVAIVEHKHVTPERIRRFTTIRLPQLADAEPLTIRAAVSEEIAQPTAAMAASFAALSDSQRATLVAMLDCAPGPVSERDLAAAARRHAPGGLERAPVDLLDRLTDHFLRSAAVGVSWVHPSWRDLVIAQLADDSTARRRFLHCCGHHGVILALSTAGGAVGTIRLPLLRDDADWDALADRLGPLLREADEQTTSTILHALTAAIKAMTSAPKDPTAGSDRALAELHATAQRSLTLVARNRPADRPVGLELLVAWLHVAAVLPARPPSPWLHRTWIELLPTAAPRLDAPTELARYEDWLTLATLLHELGYTQELDRLGHPGRQTRIALSLMADATRALERTPTGPRAERLSRLVMRTGRLLFPGQHAVQLSGQIERGLAVAERHDREQAATAQAATRAERHDLVNRVLDDLAAPDHPDPRRSPDRPW